MFSAIAATSWVLQEFNFSRTWHEDREREREPTTLNRSEKHGFLPRMLQWSITWKQEFVQVAVCAHFDCRNVPKMRIFSVNIKNLTPKPCPTRDENAHVYITNGELHSYRDEWTKEPRTCLKHVLLVELLLVVLKHRSCILWTPIKMSGMLFDCMGKAKWLPALFATYCRSFICFFSEATGRKN